MWIIGDGGSPFRAPDNTLASFRLAISEWADGVLVCVRKTSDEAFALSREGSVDVSGEKRSVESIPESEWTSLGLTDSRTGQSYRPTPFSAFLFWLSETSVRAFFEPMGSLAESGEGLAALIKSVESGKPKRSPSYILPARFVPPSLPSGSLWTFYSSRQELPAPEARKNVQAIVFASDQCDETVSGFPRVMIRDRTGFSELTGLRFPGLWGVITHSPYFARKRFSLTPPGPQI